MIFDMSYWTRVGRRILYVVLLFLGLCVGLKIAVFYMPFLVAFIISLIIEPAIKWIMRRFKLTRKTSSIIIFTIALIVILGTLIWLIATLFAESSNLLQSLNDYIDKAYIQVQKLITSLNFDKIKISNEIVGVIQNSTGDMITTISNWVRSILTGLIDFVTSIPSIAICVGITVIALYFICVDKIYILDQIEHHLPKVWVRKLGNHMKDLISTLGGYLKAEATLILVSFIISLIGLYILEFLEFDVTYPLLMALFIGFVDALPILRFWNGNGSMGHNFSN
ncbi:MAG: AI-2E family transporter [Clostridia bacterium]